MALTGKQESFCQAIVKGKSQADAYRAAYNTKKMKAESVQNSAYKLSKNGEVRARIAELASKAAGKAELSIDRTLREIARLAYSDPRKFYDSEGNLRPIHELDDDTAACISSVEVDEIKMEHAVIGHTKKVKQWDKNSALEKAMKFHGLYEKDNAQQQPVEIVIRF